MTLHVMSENWQMWLGWVWTYSEAWLHEELLSELKTWYVATEENQGVSYGEENKERKFHATPLYRIIEANKCNKLWFTYLCSPRGSPWARWVPPPLTIIPSSQMASSKVSLQNHMIEGKSQIKSSTILIVRHDTWNGQIKGYRVLHVAFPPTYSPPSNPPAAQLNTVIGQHITPSHSDRLFSITPPI